MKHFTLTLTLIALATLTGCCGPIVQGGDFDTAAPWQVINPASILDGAATLTGDGAIEQVAHFPAPGAYRFDFEITVATADTFLDLSGDFAITFYPVIGSSYMQLDIPEAGAYVFRLELEGRAPEGAAVVLESISVTPFSFTETPCPLF